MEVKLLKIDVATGVDAEHDSVNDDVKFRNIEALGDLTGNGRLAIKDDQLAETFAVENDGKVRASGTLVAAPATLSGEVVTKGQMDAAVSGVISGSTAKDPVVFTIEGSVTAGVSFMEDLASGIDEGAHTYTEDEYVLNLEDDTIYKLGAPDAGNGNKHPLNAVGASDGDRSESPATGDTRWVRFDLIDTPAAREEQALYAFNGTGYKKIASVNYAFATGIDLSGAYAATAGDAGSAVAGDSIETALIKTFGSHLKLINDLADSASVATRGGNRVGYIGETPANWAGTPADVAAAIDELASRLKAEEGKGHVTNLQDAYVGGNVMDVSDAEGIFTVKSSTGDGEMEIDITTFVKQRMVFEGTPEILNANGNRALLTTDAYVADRNYRMPEVGADADFVMSEGVQTINGAKTFADINLNGEFKIGGQAVSANVIAAALNVLTAGGSSNADDHHTHGGNSLELTADGAVAQKQLVRISGANMMKPAIADSLANAEVIGCYEGASLATSEVGNISLPGGKIEGLLSGATANTSYFLSGDTAGGVTTTPPTGSGAVVLRVGKALNATDLLFVVDQPKRRAY